MPAAEFIDLYEILQLSPNADKDTIKRVHQILSLKYQLASAGNTASAEFSQLQEAAATLLDNEARAAYDAQRLARAAAVESAAPTVPVPAPLAPAPPPSPLPAVEPAPAPAPAPVDTAISPAAGETEAADETEANAVLDPGRFMQGLDVKEEKRRRAGLVEICYRQRILKPRQPALSVKQLEDGMELTVAEMEASMWYLKETDLLRVSDAGNFAITAKGMDAIEGGYINFAECRFDMANFPR
jgi:hypothetical protein